MLAGCVSRNGYRYRSRTLAEAAALYENKPVFLDHAADPSQPRRRSARDLVGTLARVRFEPDVDGGRLRGDVRVLETESGRTFLALCEADGTGVGMSHVVLARRSPDGTHVESIEQVVSVDAVAFPATTTSFREQSNEAEPQPAVDASSPTERLGQTEPPERSDHADGDSLAQRIGQRDRMAEQIGRLESQLRDERRLRRRDRMLAESSLPADAVTEPFRRCVRAAESDNAAAALIADRQTVLDGRRPQRPNAAVSLSEARSGRAVDGFDADAFVRAVRRG